MSERTPDQIKNKEEALKEKEGVQEILPKEIRPKPFAREDSGMFEKILNINRTSKVTKGGKKMGFSALAVIGDRNGSVGCGFGKANEVSVAIKKALNDARKSMVKIPMKGSTIPHEIIGEFGAARVLLKPAGKGTGVIAGSATRAICEGAGIKDILTKCLGSNNPFNVLKATMAGLLELKDRNEVREMQNEAAGKDEE